MTKTFTVTTDANGYYHTTNTFSPPAPFGFHVEIFATFTSPAGLHVSGSVDLDAQGSTPQSKTLIAETGQKISLGSWYINHGDNILVIQGTTNPIMANTLISVDVEADLIGF